MKGFFVEGMSKTASPMQPSSVKRIRSKKTIIEAPVVYIENGETRTEIKTISASADKVAPDHKKGFAHVVEKKKLSAQKTACSNEQPERKNRVPKAAFRVTLLAILFFCVAMYSFFNLQLAFYFVLGILFITFIFALVGFFTSLNSGRDKVSTTRGGRAIGIISLLLSLAVFAAIAWFFVNTPIEL